MRRDPAVELEPPAVLRVTGSPAVHPIRRASDIAQEKSIMTLTFRRAETADTIAAQQTYRRIIHHLAETVDFPPLAHRGPSDTR